MVVPGIFVAVDATVVAGAESADVTVVAGADAVVVFADVFVAVAGTNVVVVVVVVEATVLVAADVGRNSSRS